MTKRTHSTIDQLPADLKSTITAMVIDRQWPRGYTADDDYTGGPRYEDIVSYCQFKGFKLSRSAVGRWAKKLLSIAMLKDRTEIVKAAMSNVCDEDTSQSQRAIADLLAARTLDLVLTDDSLSAKQIRDLAGALKDSATTAIKADQYRNEQLARKVTAAAESTKAKLTNAGVDRKLIQEIIDEHLGVVKS